MHRWYRWTLPTLFVLLLCAAPLHAQWRKLTAYSTTFFNEVLFTDAAHGWLTSFNGTIVRTANGGATWQTSTLPGATGSSNRDICFLSNSVGFISGEDGVWKTADGGASWTNISPTGAAANTGSAAMWFRTSQIGVWGVGSCGDSVVTFYATTDGGTTWASVSYTHSADVAVGGITYSNGTFHAAGGLGKFWQSTDDGLSWSYSNTNSAGWQEDIAVSSGGLLFTASANGSSCGSTGGGKVMVSSNGGASWTASSFPTVVMWGVTMYGALEGWSCGDGGHAFKTTDGGTTWAEYSCGMSRTDHIDDIYFVDATNGWAVGDGIYKYVGDTLTSTPDTIDFGDVVVATRSADSTARLLAFGTALQVNGRSIGGANAGDFGINGSAGAMQVLNCQTGTTNVYFLPTSVGVKIAQLNYTVQGYPNGPRVILKGRGVRPQIQSVQQQTVDTIRCTTPVQRTVRITNTGNATLILSSSFFTPTSAATFTVRSPQLPVSLDSGQWVDLVVEVTPAAGASGSYTSVMSIATNDTRPGANPWDIRLDGIIQTVSFALNPAAPLSLPPVGIGETSSSCTVYSNTGNGPQQIVEVTPLDGDTTIKHSPSAVGARLRVGDAQSLCFVGIPRDTAQHVRRFRVRTMPCGVDTIITVVLRASGAIISSQPTLAITNNQCDSTSRSERVTVYNRGNIPLEIGTGKITGTDAARFRIISPASFPITIAPGDSVVMEVLYSDPTERVDRNAQLELGSTNDKSLGNAPWKIALVGYREVRTLSVKNKVIDVGDICIETPFLTRWIGLEGIGRSAATILSPTTIEVIDSAASVKLSTVPQTVAARAIDSAEVTVTPSKLGPFRSRVLIAHGACPLYDTVTVTGRIVSTTISTLDTVQIGTVRVSTPGVRQVVVHNSGTTPASLQLANSGTGVRVISPALPVTVAAGDSITLTVEATPADTGHFVSSFALQLVGQCADSTTLVVLARGTLDAVLPELPEISMGSHVGCGGTVAIIDSLVLRNYIDKAVGVESITLVGGAASPFTLSPLALPSPIPPFGRMVAGVTVRPDAVGTLVDTVLVVLEDGSRMMVPVSVRIERVAATVSDSTGRTIFAGDLIPFATLTTCRNSSRLNFTLENTGTIGDTFTVTVQGSDFTLLSSSRFALAPDSSGTITVEGMRLDSGSSLGSVTVRNTLCGVVRDFKLLLRYEPTRWELFEAALDTAVVGSPTNGVATILNSGATVITVGDAWVENVDNSSAAVTLGSVAGMTMNPGDARKLPVSVTMSTPGEVNGTIVVHTTSPCDDTLRIPFHAVAVAAEERGTITLIADTTTGRWGTTVDLPIRLATTYAPRPTQFDVRIGLESRLLDMRSVRVHPTYAGSWRASLVERTGDSATIRVEAIESLTALPPAQDSFLLVECEVLRGDLISSTVGLAPGAITGSGTTLFTTGGMFALADYCDAYGRLLRITGGIVLRPAAPNPFVEQTTIEYETPFAGEVKMVLIDERGNEVATLVHGYEPAGRRRIALDGNTLPPGHYTCRMTIGLQRLETSIIHVR